MQIRGATLAAIVELWIIQHLMPIVFKIFSRLNGDHNVCREFTVPFRQFNLNVFTKEKVTLQEMFRRDEVFVRERVRANEFTIIDGVECAVNEEAESKDHSDADVFESLN